MKKFLAFVILAAVSFMFYLAFVGVRHAGQELKRQFAARPPEDTALEKAASTAPGRFMFLPVHLTHVAGQGMISRAPGAPDEIELDMIEFRVEAVAADFPK